jgi:hypothetical protein
MSAIPCASVSLKTMADGTLRISFDIEPMHAQDAFRLFAAPGTPAAIAALQVGYAAVGETIEPKPEPLCQPEKPKGGPLSKLAAMWCNQPEFWAWLETDDENAAHSEFGATMCVYALCGIESRAELDHDEIAAEKFHRLIRGPYSKYLQARGAI